MSLERIRDERIFDDVSDDAQRVRMYVRAAELGIAADADPEVALMQTLVDRDAPQRVHVVGPSGAGKTSLILRVIADLSRRDLDVRHEVLVLRVGDQPENLASPTAVMQMVLESVAAAGARFSSVSPQVLQAAAADERTVTASRGGRRVNVGVSVVGYSSHVEEAFETLKFGQSAARVRQDLEDVLRFVREAGYRPVLVLDDTEKFASPGADGNVDVDSIHNLFHHGVRALGTLSVDLVIAMHPRFENVSSVKEISARLGTRRIEVAELPADVDDPALGRILARRLERHGIQQSLDSTIDLDAISDLQILYHDHDRDLRSVLRLADRAVAHAVDRSATRVTARDVRAVVALAQRSS